MARLWGLIVGAVALTLLGTVMAPSRTALIGALLLLLLPVAALRREGIVPILLIIAPFYTLIRRLLLLREPAVLNLDPLILLPDLIVLVAGVHLLFAVRFLRRPLRRSPAGESGSGALEAAPARRGVRPKAAAVDYMVGALVAITLIGFVVGMRNGLVPALNGARTFGLYILLYFFARITLRRWRQVGDLFAITLLNGLVTGLYGIYQTLVGLPRYDQIYFENTSAREQVIGSFVRAFSTFQFTSHFSVFMLIAFFCALTLFQQRTGRTTRVFCLATMLTAVVAAATTFVRSTWIGMASGLVAYLLLRWVRHPLLRWAVVAVLVPMIYVASTQMARDERARRPQAADSASQVVQLRAQSVLTARPETDLLGRYLGLQAALRTAAAGPFGFGLGSTSAERFGGGPVAWSGDSQITTLLAELGWPGLLCFVAILVLVVRCNVKAIDAAGSPDLRTLLVGMAGIQIGLIVTSLTGGPLWYSQPTCLYAWLLAGVTVNAAEGRCSVLGARCSARQGHRLAGWPGGRRPPLPSTEHRAPSTARRNDEPCTS